MTKEQHQGALLFIDAIESDMANNKTNLPAKIGIKMQLQQAIKSRDAKKAIEAVKKYHGLFA